MAEDDDFEIDPAMAEAMGFSSFGMQPGKKRKFNPDDGFVVPKATSTHSQQGHQGQLDGIARDAGRDQGEQQKLRQDDTASTTAPRGSTATASNILGDDERSLQALAYGVRNENGDMVYFQPSFLEDPWKHLRPR